MFSRFDLFYLSAIAVMAVTVAVYIHHDKKP